MSEFGGWMRLWVLVVGIPALVVITPVIIWICCHLEWKP